MMYACTHLKPLTIAEGVEIIQFQADYVGIAFNLKF